AHPPSPRIPASCTEVPLVPLVPLDPLDPASSPAVASVPPQAPSAPAQAKAAPARAGARTETRREAVALVITRTVYVGSCSARPRDGVDRRPRHADHGDESQHRRIDAREAALARRLPSDLVLRRDRGDDRARPP